MLLLAAGGAFAGVNVSYTQPELFSDVPFAPWERERILKELSRHFAKMGAALPASQDLNITVTDCGASKPNENFVASPPFL